MKFLTKLLTMGDVETKINQRLKKIREDLNLTQSAMAQQLGLLQGSYSAMERTSKGISGPVLKLLEIKFNINIEFLLKGTGKPFIEKKEVIFNEHKREIELMKSMIEVLKESNQLLKNQILELQKKGKIITNTPKQ